MFTEPQYPLRHVRSAAERALTELADDQRLAPANRRGSDDYWIGRLAEAVRELLDATAGEGGGK